MGGLEPWPRAGAEMSIASDLRFAACRVESLLVDLERLQFCARAYLDAPLTGEERTRLREQLENALAASGA
jgi:hypothetical protein